MNGFVQKNYLPFHYKNIQLRKLKMIRNPYKAFYDSSDFEQVSAKKIFAGPSLYNLL